MAATIRLKRVGRKKQATFRIVVIDRSEGTSGRSVERLGLYNPRTQPSLIRLDAARTIHWLREGATPSDSVRSLLRKTGVWAQFHEGVGPEELEQPIVVIGPAEGGLRTSQRPAPEVPAAGRREVRAEAGAATEEVEEAEEVEEVEEVGEAPEAGAAAGPEDVAEGGESEEARAAGAPATEAATDAAAAGEGPEAEKAPATDASDAVREASSAKADEEPTGAAAEPEAEGEAEPDEEEEEEKA